MNPLTFRSSRNKEEDFEGSLNKSALWAITYGDLMSFMSIFFLIMFVFASSKSLGVQMAMRGVQKTFGNKSSDAVLKGLFSKEGLKNVATVEVKDKKIRIVFTEPVLFPSGSATLRPGAQAVLARVADVLAALPNPVTIEGHTDPVPLRPGSAIKTNWELSMARAYTVLRFMIDQAHLKESRLSAVGYGEFKPVQSNDTPEGRAANRRIEINILPEES